MAKKLNQLTAQPSTPADSDVIAWGQAGGSGLAYKMTFTQLKAKLDAMAGGGDTTAPAISSRTVENATPNRIDLTYNEALDTGSVPANGDFTVSGGRTVTGVAVVGSQVRITVNTAYANGDTITVGYTPGTNKIQDVAGNDAPAITAGTSVTNNISGGYDADAETFFTNYSITDTGQKNAVNPMVGGAKTATLWASKILDWHPIVGGTSGRHAGNLRRPTSPYELTYRGTPTHSATGMACPSGDNGATINVNFDASGGAETANINDIGIGIYVHTNIAVATLAKYLMGLTGTNSHGFNLIPRYSNDQFYCQMTDSGGNIQAATPGVDSRGFWFMTRTASNVGKLYHNGVQVGSTYTGTPSTPAGAKMGVGGGFDNFGAYQGSEHTVSNFIRTLGVSDSEVATLSGLINACETALGRNTY